MIAAPPWKWLGGKRKLLFRILPILPKRIATYYEPFVGGGAVFFALAEQKRFERAVLIDTNRELIRSFVAIRDNVDGVIGALKTHVYDESEYYAFRALDPDKLEDEACASRFIYLNKTGFNGLYRVNKSGKFNVPFGRYENPTICDEDNLRAASAVLQGVEIRCGDFSEALAQMKKGDATYGDPPYVPASVTSNFTAYSAGGFGSVEQARLETCARKAKGFVLLSNSDTPFSRALYKDWSIEEVSASRSINSKGEKRGKVGELLITRKR